MVLVISDGNSENAARKEQYLLFDLFMAFDQSSDNIKLFFPKMYIFLHACNMLRVTI